MGQLIQLRRSSSVDDLTDHGLAAACAAGDAAAQALVFSRHAPAMYRFIARMRGRAHDVEDLVQLAFIAAFTSIGSFTGARLSSWLYGVAANVVRGQARKDGSRRRMHDAFAETVDSTAPAVDADIPKLREAIASLPHDLREVIVLVDLEGERGADVAISLKISESTVWARLARARERLRDALGASS